MTLFSNQNEQTRIKRTQFRHFKTTWQAFWDFDKSKYTKKPVEPKQIKKQKAEVAELKAGLESAKQKTAF